MATIKTCLIVSDDPDDHQILAEAFKEVSDKIVVLIRPESTHLLQLLSEQHLSPSYLMIDASTEGFDASFVRELRTIPHMATAPLLIYGMAEEQKRFEGTAYTFVDKQWKYSDLLKRLGEVVKS